MLWGPTEMRNRMTANEVGISQTLGYRQFYSIRVNQVNQVNQVNLLTI